MSRRKSNGCLGLIFLGAALFACVSSTFPMFDNSSDGNSSQALTTSRGPRVVLPTDDISSATRDSTTQPVAEVLLLPTVTPTEDPDPPDMLGVYGVTTDALNVRKAPDVASNIVGTLQAGECVEIVTEQAGWYGVATDALGGWSSSAYITVVDTCPTATETEPIAISTDEAPPPTSEQNIEVVNTLPGYVNQPFAPNAVVAREGWMYECFGQGDNGIRAVGAGTPVQILGVGSYAPTSEQQAFIGSGPFYKIRIWDGQFGWIATALVDTDPLAFTTVSGICEDYDSIDWTTVVRPTATPTIAPLPTWTTIVATPSSYSPSWTPNTNPARGCCKICSKGKPCGNTCISRNYTCHVGPGCAC